MNWIKNLTRPTVKKAQKQKDIPDNFWDRCPGCGAMLFHSEITNSDFVCPYCNHHFRLPAQRRFEMMFDKAEYNLVQLSKTMDDPLHFVDLHKYSDKLKAARKKTKQEDAIQIEFGTIGGHSAVVGVLDFSFIGGSMGTAMGEAIIRASQLAQLQEAALILVTASGGARMQEGILSLMQMPRTIVAAKQLRKKKLPYIVLLTDPTAGGVTASFAMLGDITLAEPGATIGFAGKRVIEQTVREKLPDDFQTSEYLLDHGMIDEIVPRDKIHTVLTRILNLLHRV